MKKLLVLGAMLLSMLACSKSSSDTNDALNESTVDFTKEIVFVDDVSKSVNETTSKSIMKSISLSDAYNTARSTFQSTAGNGHGAYLKTDGYGNILEFGIMTDTFVAVNKFNKTSDNLPFFAKVQGELNHFTSLQKNWETDEYTESTTRSGGVTTEKVSLNSGEIGIIKYDSLGRVIFISDNFNGYELDIDGAILKDATGNSSEITYTNNVGTIGNLKFTYTYDNNKMTGLKIENSNNSSVVTINYTYLNNGYSKEMIGTGNYIDNSMIEDVTYETQTINGVTLVKSFIYTIGESEFMKVSYARNGSSGEINNAVVKLSVKDDKTGKTESIVGTLVRK